MSARLLPALAVLAAVSAAARGQGGVRATVVYAEPGDGRQVSVDTEVRKESPAGVEVPFGQDVRRLPPSAVVRVDYAALPGADPAALLAARLAAEAGDPAKARGVYADLLAKASDPRAKRYLGYKAAAAAAAAADAKAGEAEFRAEAEPAAQALAEFVKAHPQAWEVWPAARTAARLLTELGRPADAAAVLGRLAAVPDLPADLRLDALLGQAAALLRAGRPAAPVLADVGKDPRLPATGPLRQRLAVLKAAADLPADGSGSAAGLEKAIAEASDPTARAVGYSLLGDWQRGRGQVRDAMWSYLWVDAVYPADGFERAVAVRRLAEAFEQQGDAERAAAYREKLPAVR